MAEQPIKYSDLISPDDSIEKLIQQLEQLNESYTNMANGIKTQAAQVSASLKSVSGATEQGRKATKDANDEATRLQKAYKQLDAALSENAKEIARLNAVKREANQWNKMLVQRGKDEIRTSQQIKEASYQQLSAQYSLNKAYINSLSATDRRNQKNRELIKSTKEIYEQMKKLQADTGKMQLNVGNYPQLGNMISQLGMLTVGIGSATAAATTAISALKDGITVAKDYQHSLSGLAAILGTTTDNITELREQSENLGATTVFTASEVAQLQTELAKLGYSVDDILAMTPNVLAFAQATGSSLADAASLTGAALRMFEKDTSHTQEFVDKMTASTTKSALSFSYLNNAMSTVAPVANAFGFKIEEVLALLGQLANAGFDASSAATATRNILLNLADANGKLATALGSPVTNLDELIAGLNKLNGEGIDLGEALDLTDKRSVAAFNTFLSGTDTVINLRNELNNATGAAQKMADTMADNLTGDIAGLQSAWQGLMIEINDGQGILRSFIQALTELIRGVGNMYREVKGFFVDMYDSMAVFRWYVEQVGETLERVFNSTLLGRVSNIFSMVRRMGGGSSDEGGGTTQVQPRQRGATGFLGDDDEGSHAGLIAGKTTTTGGKTNNKKGGSSSKSAYDKQLKEQEQAEKQSLELRRMYEDAMIEMYDEEADRERAKILLTYNRKIEDLQAQLKKEKNLTEQDRENINKTIVALEEAKNIKIADSFDKFSKKLQDEQEQQRKQNLRDSEKAIDLQHKIDLAEIDSIEASEREKTRMRLEAEKERLQKLLALYEADGKILSNKEVELLKQQIANVDKQLSENKPQDIYDLLGFNLTDERKEALNKTFSYALDAMNTYIDAWIEAANRKVEAANKEVDAAQSMLEAEIEARNQGYAHNVEMAQKELEFAKKNQEKALKEQAAAQRAQEALDTATQVSSLVTATANIWKAFTGIGPWGVAAAIAATALMWGSFAAAKLKAASVAGTGQGTEEYGEGTVELLQGGSHLSGNDIDLGRKKDGTRRRAEGGEFFAVINRRNSRRYRKVIPDVIHSLNDGTFADKYMQAFPAVGGTVVMDNGIDLTEITNDVREIRKQNSRRVYIDQDGNVIEEYKNVKRKIMKS